MAYDAAFGTQGAQRIAPPANAGMIDSVISANNDGVAKEMLVTIGVDSGSGGKIAAGDYFEVQVTELLHPDETSATWPETAVKAAAETFTVSLYAVAGETTEQIRNRLLNLINAQTASDHLPTAVADGTNGIRFTAGKPGEDYNLSITYSSTADSLIGSRVVENVPQTSFLEYSLVPSTGGNDNHLFHLDQDGTLKTATTFDFESNASTYTIRVQAKDEFNATVEGNFTVMLTDLYEPSQPNHFVDLNATVNLEMIWVEPGTFIMGDSDLSNASPEHNVTLTKGFYLGKYEVTQAQYVAVMVGNDENLSPTPSQWPNNPNRPVEKVSWQDIQVFITRLNDQQAGSLPVGWAYDLPTEAQWEYACRAGTTTAYSWGN